VDPVTIKTVLLVDGSPAMLYYHGILLKRLGYSVLAAASPEDALKMIEQTIPTLILTAISFSMMTGIDFVKKIKISGKTRTVPVIVLTAAEDDSSKSSCFDLGCVAYLPKPVDPIQLYRTMQAATEQTPRENIRIGTSAVKVAIGNETSPRVDRRTGYATTISEGGFYLRTLTPQQKNVRLPVTVIIKEREIKATAIVLYTHNLEDGLFKEPGMALKFTELKDDDREFLRGFIHSELTDDIEAICNTASSVH
jgi:CheY-like chemotaxis protein